MLLFLLLYGQCKKNINAVFNLHFEFCYLQGILMLSDFHIISLNYIALNVKKGQKKNRHHRGRSDYRKLYGINEICCPFRGNYNDQCLVHPSEQVSRPWPLDIWGWVSDGWAVLHTVGSIAAILATY